MARPQSASDEEILHAAHKVLRRLGPDAFSLSEVAAEVGLSRGAITMRFKSAHALKVALLASLIERFSAGIDALPKSPSGESLLRLAAFIGSHPTNRKRNASFFANYTSNLRDRELIALEIKRGEVLCTAISHAMPPVNIDHTAAVNAFLAHLAGVTLAWAADTSDPEPKPFFVTRTAEWLGLAGIPFSPGVVEELCAAAPRPGAKNRAARKSTAPKATRARKRVRASKARTDIGGGPA